MNEQECIGEECINADPEHWRMECFTLEDAETFYREEQRMEEPDDAP